MKRYIKIIFLVLTIGIVSCEKYFEPVNDNSLTEEVLLRRLEYAEGVMVRGYIGLPNDYLFYTDIPTDDAVTNVKGSAYTNMGTGEWSSSKYPGNPWSNAYTQIFYMNKFLNEVIDKIEWVYNPIYTQEENETRERLTKSRMRGEAYGLRALYKFQLLQHHSGKIADGSLRGFPIINKNITPGDDWQLPRNTFTECVESIFEDIDSAIVNLPDEYADQGVFYLDDIYGVSERGRINGKAAKALKSRAALLAASPAYSESGVITWAEAATISGDFLEDIGALLPAGKTFYTSIKNKEIIWNRASRSINTWERDNYPPSLFGSARTNPSQNLVDAFPMKNGYPINHDLSTYDEDNPYANRDERLNDYILYNESIFKTKVINTYIGADQNGIDVLETSTRSGYYLKKFMIESVTLTPGGTTIAPHTYTLFRETEVLLNFVEAANEAWGPDGDPNGYGFTARTKLGELRARAGITDPDEYLASLVTKEEFRALIRNERRLELSFEGFRFWDIRRWNDVTTMQAPVKGAFITEEAGVYTYDYREVENRVFEPYMIYGPVPFTETLKYDIVQNNGWISN